MQIPSSHPTRIIIITNQQHITANYAAGKFFVVCQPLQTVPLQIAVGVFSGISTKSSNGYWMISGCTNNKPNETKMG